MTPEIVVQQTPEEKWGLYVNGILIGDAKNRFDADHSVVMLRRALGIKQQTGITVDLTTLPPEQHKTAVTEAFQKALGGNLQTAAPLPGMPLSGAAHINTESK